MPVEAFTFITSLNATNPIGATDSKSQGDDHLRGIKSVLLATFPNLSAAVTSDATELNYLDGATGVTGTGNTVRSVSPTLTGTVNVAALTASGGILGADGAAAAPSFSFGSDLDTGMYRVAADNLGLATGGVRRVQFGSFGIRNDVDGSAAAPSYHWDSDPDTGLYREGVNSFEAVAGATRAMQWNALSVISLLPLRHNQFGTAAAPSYAWNDDPDLGIYRAAADVLAIATGGVRRVQFGSFGIRNDVDGSAAAPSWHWDSDPDSGWYRVSDNAIGLTVGGAQVAQFRSSATGSLDIKDEAGTLFTAGFRDIPRRTSGFARAQMLAISAGVTLNTSDMAAGYAFSVYNDSAAAITITQGVGVTLRLAGTGTTGNRTIPARGVATIWCNSGTEAVISGQVS